MNLQVKQDISEVLSDLYEILKQRDATDPHQVKVLSNHVIHDATLFQDKESVSIAVFIYALAKVMERCNNILDYQKINKELSGVCQALKEDQLQHFRKGLRELFAMIKQADSQVQHYIGDVLNHAQAKKGVRMCQHGLSCAQTAYVLNIPQWELMQYIGKTSTIKAAEGHDIRSRLKFARGVFS